MKLHTGDIVVVITGKDKGKNGRILRVLSHKNHVVVEGINMRTKHIRKTPQRAGQKIRYEASLSASNVMIIDPETKKRSRVGYQVKDGNKVRLAKKSRKVLSREKRSGEKKEAGAKIAEAKETKESAKLPAKKPFWQRLGFGTDALSEMDEVKESSHMHEDHEVPGDGQLQSTRGHQRGS